ncbi:hypothetical protein E2C01_035136 [Portunus trituberculatus]|uniref:Uncharacterized protein n=1 Tax=Portunus trituberculatus TaxID=210409 RepID=A0A5B7F7M4_PORTR|nr:hypothetical protein [Portunus trituberculatus]
MVITNATNIIINTNTTNTATKNTTTTTTTTTTTPVANNNNNNNNLVKSCPVMSRRATCGGNKLDPVRAEVQCMINGTFQQEGLDIIPYYVPGDAVRLE